MSTKHALADYELTLPYDSNLNRDPLLKIFKEYFKKWCFQKEKTDKGYVHWQCNGSLIKKRRLQEILPILTEAGLEFGRMSPLHDTKSMYCMKADTRIEGPWSDKDPEPPMLTTQIEAINDDTLYPWQKSIKESIIDYDDRTINVLYCEEGGSGKSGFSEWMEYHNLWFEIPMMRLMEDIMQCVMCFDRKNAYCVDMPRAMKKDKLFDFYSGMECLKNGHVYDKRYKFKKRRMTRPHIWIMCNQLPDQSMLTRNRWKVWMIDGARELAPYGVKDEPVSSTATADASAQEYLTVQGA